MLKFLSTKTIGYVRRSVELSFQVVSLLLFTSISVKIKKGIAIKYSQNTEWCAYEADSEILNSADRIATPLLMIK